jgi:hypothetical protein
MKFRLIIFLAVSLLLPLAVYSQKEEQFIKAAKVSEIIIVAEVVERFWSPGFWSGALLSAQNVKYKVIATLTGELADDDLIAGHYIFYGNYMADEKIPQLSPKLFKVGNKLILLLSTEDTPCRNTYITAEKKPPYCAEAVHPFSENLVEKIKGVIKN